MDDPRYTVSICNQPPIPSQPDHLSFLTLSSRGNEYWQKCIDLRDMFYLLAHYFIIYFLIAVTMTLLAA